MAGFSPNEFMSNIETMGGISRRWKYSVQITPPSKLLSSVPNGKIDFLALSVDMPGKSMATTEHRMYGINKTVPYETGYEPVALTMLDPNDWSTRTFWNEWLQYIQKPASKNISYYKDMVGTITITHFGDEANEIDPSKSQYSVTLHEAWPERIGPYSLGWENEEPGNFEISIRYKEWTDTASQ